MSRAGIPPLGSTVGEGVVVLAAKLLPGDEITEIDSPQGPWYRVLLIDPTSLTLDGRLPGDEEPLVVSVPLGASGAVLRRSP
jgi:hypothetical protein